MRIAHVTDFYLPRLGGIEMHVHDLAARQQVAGHDVEVITSTPATPQHPDAATTGVEDGFRVHRLTVDRTLPPMLNPALLRAGRMLVEQGRYDVVHVHSGAVSPLAFAVAALADRYPTVLTAHSLLAYLEPLFRVVNAGVAWRRWPAVWTAVSDLAAAPLRRLVAPAPVHVLPNAIDVARWRVDRQPHDPGEVLVVAVNRLAPRKRPLHLLGILRRARRILPARIGLRAVIAGDGPLRARMEAYLRRHRMTGWVSLPGSMPRPAIATLLSTADLFVAPATLESFGIAALEARCAGLPVVARLEGGVGGFIRDGVDGLLVGSDADMAAAIVRLAGDADLRGRITAHNRATAPPLDWSCVLERITALYALAGASRYPVLDAGA